MSLPIFGKNIKIKIILLAVLLPLVLSGCSILNFFSKHEMAKASPEGLYASASSEYKNGSYKKAREHFMRLKEEYPLHEMAILAEIGIADSYYSDKDYAEAENAYKDFMALHPVNDNLPYVIYQMGMCHYNQMEAIDRDQTETISARKEFERLSARYPDSKFTPMAEKTLREVKQKLAEREFYIGKFYVKQKKYQAALSRFEKIAHDYSNIGVDYKVEYYIKEMKEKIAEEEKIKLKKEAEEKKKEEEKNKKEEEKKKKEEEKKKKSEKK
jgi:outer membrane protein assembly factor BamD